MEQDASVSKTDTEGSSKHKIQSKIIFLIGNNYVVYDQKISTKGKLVCGIPQGSILGPLLFLFTFMTSPLFSWRQKYFVFPQSNRAPEQLEKLINHELNKISNSPVSQYERPRAVALASSACFDKTTKIITEFTRKDPFLHLKRAN